MRRLNKRKRELYVYSYLMFFFLIQIKLEEDMDNYVSIRLSSKIIIITLLKLLNLYIIDCTSRNV